MSYDAPYVLIGKLSGSYYWIRGVKTPYLYLHAPGLGQLDRLLTSLLKGNQVESLQLVILRISPTVQILISGRYQ